MYIQCVIDDDDNDGDECYLACKDKGKETGKQYVNKLIRIVQTAVDVILLFL